MAISLLNQAVKAGARLFKACAIIGISVRTYKRWCQPNGLNDKRELVEHKPANKLSQEEYNRVLSTCNSEEYRSLPPSQIVPMFADEGVYIASESTFYRILRKDWLPNPSHSRQRQPIKCGVGTLRIWLQASEGSSIACTLLWIFLAVKSSVGKSMKMKALPMLRR